MLSLSNDFDKHNRLQQKGVLKQSNDSIYIWIDSAKNRSFNSQKRKYYLDKAYKKSLIEPNDSIRNNYFSKISFIYYRLNDSFSFRTTNRKVINLSIKLKDSSKIGDSYWDLGNFHSNRGIKDSAFYFYSKAQKVYEILNDSHYSGRMFLNMAIIQSDIKDYTGSEVSTIRAIALLKPLKKYRHLYRCYNNLAINFDELEEFDEAFFYHNKALEYLKKIKTKNTFKENTYNNIGVSYQLQKIYGKAIEYYKLGLEEKNLKHDNASLYAKLLDNLAYSKYKLNDTLNVKNLFYTSLKIRDSINDYLGIAVNKLHLAEYYSFLKDTTKAKQLAIETKKITTETKNYRELLLSLLLLSRLDKKNSSNYTNQYIELDRSLQKDARATRNKFERIQFETNEFIDKNKRLSQEINIILLTSICIILLGALLYLFVRQRAKEKELHFVQYQQQNNEEIYNLMLTQQDKLEEVRKKEKKRISEELHDGVLGKLFGTRLILGSLNTKTDKISVSEREKYIRDLQEIEEEVRNVSHELNSKAQFSDIGYTQMVNNLLEDQSKITNFEYITSYDERIIWEKINGSLKMNLYRIIQEAIQNINKHSKAQYVDIEFKNEDDQLFLSIKDDGIGFDSEIKRKGIGLKNMKSRVDKLKANLYVKSNNGKGTIITIKVPLNH